MAPTKHSIPGILLSGDRPTTVATPNPPELPLPTPETASVWVGAQDPHTLCVQWELPARDLDATRPISEEGGVHLRVIADAPAPQCVSEERLDPGSLVTFVSVPNAGVPYHAEIGTRAPSGEWQVLAESTPTHTPPAAPARAEDYAEAVWVLPPAAAETTPNAASAASEPPGAPAGFTTDWDTAPSTDAQAPAARVATPPPPALPPPTLKSSRTLTRLSLGSDALENASSHSLAKEGPEEDWVEASGDTPIPAATANPGLPSSEALAASAGDLGPEEADHPGKRAFWFRINTEVVIYGSTEPGATVTIGDQEVKVRPDGTFSFRFALPDGAYPLPVVAASADRRETRAARVELSRVTGLQGPVEPHPQCPTLQPPLPENCR